MIQAAAYGRLGDEPRSFDTKTGTRMVTAALAVNVDDPENSAPIWFRIITFGRVAEELLRHGKGDLVSVCGRVRRNSWKDRDGNARERLEVIADAVISTRTVRPSGGRRKQQETAS